MPVALAAFWIAPVTVDPMPLTPDPIALRMVSMIMVSCGEAGRTPRGPYHGQLW